jgi:hypothetical protein
VIFESKAQAQGAIAKAKALNSRTKFVDKRIILTIKSVKKNEFFITY